MASIWKRGGRSNKGGTFYCTLTDATGQRSTRSTFNTCTSDRGAAEETVRRVEKLLAYRGAHKIADAELSAWQANMPQRLRRQLVKAGILQGADAAEGRPLAFHLIGYAHALKAKGDDAKHVRLTIRAIGSVIRALDAHHWPDLTPASVTRHLERRRIGKSPISARTYNGYVGALIAFGNWAVKAGRLASNPLSGLSKLDTTDDEVRWPLTFAEMVKLLETTEQGRLDEKGMRLGAVERFGMTGPERALCYRVAVETGYRAGELASLIGASFDLTTTPATVRLLAGSSKGKRRSSIPLRPDTAELLKRHLAKRLPSGPAFNLPATTHTAEMIRADLIDAKIPLIDDLKRKRDFHSLRHTCGTWLANLGTHPKTIQTIMRHSTIRLTMDRYTHSDRDQTSAALGRMPSLPMPLAATGTDGPSGTVETRAAQSAARNQQSSFRDHAPVGAETAAPINAATAVSAGDPATKTPDLAGPALMGAVGFEPTEALSQQIYSLPRLATSVHALANLGPPDYPEHARESNGGIGPGRHTVPPARVPGPPPLPVVGPFLAHPGLQTGFTLP